MKRKIAKLKFYILKFPISFINYFDARLYMHLYNKLLISVGVKINGTPRFIAKNVKFDNFEKIYLGDRLVVSMNVYFLTHDYSYTTALISVNEKPPTDIAILREIRIGNNVFIGMNSIILPGTTIGNNVIIGAGSVVRGNIPDNSIVFGNPAIIRSNIKDFATKTKNREDQVLFRDKK